MAQRFKLNQGNQAELSNNSALVQRLRKILQKKHRKSFDEFLVEGPSLVEEGLKAKQLTHIFYTQDFLDRRELIAKAKIVGIPTYLISNKTLKSISETASPAGILAISNLKISLLSKLAVKNFSQIIYLDEVQDPGNAGTIIRGAAAFGFSAVIFSIDSVDPTNLKVARASAGSIFQIPIFLSESLKELDEWGFEINIAKADGNLELLEAAVKDRQVWVFSNEARGSRSSYDNYQSVRIPIKTQTESLNVAQAASILMWQLSNKINAK